MPASRRILILGGTTEARALADALFAERPFRHHLARRPDGEPRRPQGEIRIGGFGGAAGLADLSRRSAGIDVVIDATHPYAAAISAHASRGLQRCRPTLAALRACALAAAEGRPLDRRRQPGSRGKGRARSRPARLSHHRRQGTVELSPASAISGFWFDWSTGRRSRCRWPHHELILARGPFQGDEQRALLRRNTDRSGHRQEQRRRIRPTARSPRPANWACRCSCCAGRLCRRRRRRRRWPMPSPGSSVRASAAAPCEAQTLFRQIDTVQQFEAVTPIKALARAGAPGTRRCRPDRASPAWAIKASSNLAANSARALALRHRHAPHETRRSRAGSSGRGSAADRADADQPLALEPAEMAGIPDRVERIELAGIGLPGLSASRRSNQVCSGDTARITPFPGASGAGCGDGPRDKGGCRCKSAVGEDAADEDQRRAGDLRGFHLRLDVAQRAADDLLVGPADAIGDDHRAVGAIERRQIVARR